MHTDKNKHKAYMHALNEMTLGKWIHIYLYNWREKNIF